MNKNILLVIAGVVIIGMGLFLGLGSTAEDTVKNTETTDETTNNSTATEPTGQTVKYTDDGFEPSSIEVTVGESVTFVNNSNRSMWVASDDHPTHTDMPEFDDKGGIGPGESYRFTFEEAGEWGYHDHLNSSNEGSVTVTE